MELIRAYSQQQLKTLGFDSKGYILNKASGMFTGRLDMKMWGKKSNLISFYTLSEGRKILWNAWHNKDYCGVDKLPLGGNVELVFTRTSRGNAALSEVRTVG